MPGARLCRLNDAPSRLRAPDDARIDCPTPRTRDGNFDRTDDQTKSVDAAQSQLSARVLRASLRAAVRSLPSSPARGNFGAQESFPTRRSRAERVEHDEDPSPPLEAASEELSSDGACACLRVTEPISWSRA